MTLVSLSEKPWKRCLTVEPGIHAAAGAILIPGGQ